MAEAGNRRAMAQRSQPLPCKNGIQLSRVPSVLTIVARVSFGSTPPSLSGVSEMNDVSENFIPVSVSPSAAKNGLYFIFSLSNASMSLISE